MKDAKLRFQAMGLLILFSLQFLAGMLLNLFVTIPASHPGDSGNDYFVRSTHSLVWSLSGHGGWQLTIHVYLGVLLVLGSIALFVRATKERDAQWRVLGGIAALFTLGAFFNGLSFIDFNKNLSSMIMATCWVVAVGALVAGLLKQTPASYTKQTLKTL
jgi:hypothetical protein